MIAKFKSKFMPKDYQLNLFRQLQNIKQKGMTVKEYTKEFYRLTIRVGHIEEDVEKVVRYINGLRYDIQDEISILFLKTVEDAYQAALKAEEKLARKQSQKTEEEVQQEAKENPVTEEDFRLQEMKEAVQAQVISHQEEENPEA
jgi:hypothetical protein